MDEDTDDASTYNAAAGFGWFKELPPKDAELSCSDLRALLQDVERLRCETTVTTTTATTLPTTAVAPARPVDSTPDLLRIYDESRSCGTLIVAFGGLSQSSGGLASHEFMGAIKRAGGHHALFVKDPKQAWYQHGLRDGHPSFEGVIEIVAAECALLQPKRLIMIGASMGGYAAIRAGCRLGASLVVAFAPQVYLAPTARAYLQLPYQAFDTRLASVAATCAAAGIDLLAAALPGWLIQADAGDSCTSWRSPLDRCVIDVHAGTRAPGDVLELALLHEASVTATGRLGAIVHTHTHPGLGHALVRELKLDGKLDTLLAAALRPPSAYDDRASLLYGLRGVRFTGASSAEGAEYNAPLGELLESFHHAQCRSGERLDAGAWAYCKIERKLHWAALGVQPYLIVPTLYSSALEIDESTRIPAPEFEEDDEFKENAEQVKNTRFRLHQCALQQSSVPLKGRRIVPTLINSRMQ